VLTGELLLLSVPCFLFVLVLAIDLCSTGRFGHNHEITIFHSCRKKSNPLKHQRKGLACAACWHCYFLQFPIQECEVLQLSENVWMLDLWVLADEKCSAWWSAAKWLGNNWWTIMTWSESKGRTLCYNCIRCCHLHFRCLQNSFCQKISLQM